MTSYLLARIPETLLHWAPPPRRVRYARAGRAGPFDLPRMVIEEEWGEPFERDERVVFRRVARAAGPEGEVGPDARVVEDALIAYGTDGLFDLGTFDSEGELSLWSPPHRVLPAPPVAGESWKAEHERGGSTSERSVEIIACTDHPDCLMAVVETVRPEGRMVMRSHYTEGVGFCAFEALTAIPGQPEVRTWSEAVTVVRREK